MNSDLMHSACVGSTDDNTGAAIVVESLKISPTVFALDLLSEKAALWVSEDELKRTYMAP